MIVAIGGALTAIMAASIGIAQNDIKKVLAYSTISQLGFMVAAVGMGAFVAGMFQIVLVHGIVDDALDVALVIAHIHVDAEAVVVHVCYRLPVVVS